MRCVVFGKSKYFSEGMILYRGFSLLKSEHPLFLHFPGLFFKMFSIKVEAFRHNLYWNEYLFRNAPKSWQKSGLL